MSLLEGSRIERFGSWFTAHVGPRYEVGNVADTRKAFWTLRGVRKFLRMTDRLYMHRNTLSVFRWTGETWKRIEKEATDAH